MARASKIAVWLGFTGLPAFIVYLTDAGGAASRLNTAVNSFAPTIGALLPFVAISGVAVCLGALLPKIGPPLFELMPMSVKLRFAFYRNQRTRGLYPVLEEATRLHDEGPWDSFQSFRSYLNFVTVKLNEIGLHTTSKDQSAWWVFIQQLAPFAREGSYREVQRLCDEFMQRGDV